jgi:hypothetical protein
MIDRWFVSGHKISTWMNDDISNKMAAHLDTHPSGQPAQPPRRTSKIIVKITLRKHEQRHARYLISKRRIPAF